MSNENDPLSTVNPNRSAGESGAEWALPVDSIPNGHPIGFWFFFWGEFAERCSYYGMRGILLLYMSEELGFAKENANTIMSLFMAACYLLTLIGGYVADNFFGKYRTIVGFSLPYILGHFILGIENRACLAIALALLAMGSGVIKPNISSLMGMTYDRERPGDVKLRSTAFAMFYWAINLGAFISQFSMPWIRSHWGYQIAFIFPTVFMAVAFVVFALGKKHYAVETIVRRKSTPEERSLKIATVTRLGGLFALVMFFWAIFDQAASTWIFFARDYMDCTLFGVEIDPDQIQSFNPLFILALLPVVTVSCRILQNMGFRVSPTDKMLTGFFLTAMCMAIMAISGWIATPEAKVSVIWQIGAYLAITVAEVLISVTGLELAFVEAPKEMKSFVTAMWQATVGLANLFINAPVTRLYSVWKPGVYFGALAAAIVVVSICFAFVARSFARKNAKAAEK